MFKRCATVIAASVLVVAFAQPTFARKNDRIDSGYTSDATHLAHLGSPPASPQNPVKKPTKAKNQ